MAWMRGFLPSGCILFLLTGFLYLELTPPPQQCLILNQSLSRPVLQQATPVALTYAPEPRGVSLHITLRYLKVVHLISLGTNRCKNMLYLTPYVEACTLSLSAAQPHTNNDR